MKKLLQIIAISCMPFLTGIAVAADPNDPYARYNFDGGTGFERLGFGFAQPIITIIPGHTNNDGDAFRPVVIIAGGYDPTKDYIGAHGAAATGDPGAMEGRGPATAASKTRHEDRVGNAIYFIDGMSGELVARVRGTNSLPPGTTAETVAEGVTDVSHDDLDHSIPATVTIVDSQGDGVTDRVYFIDVIGNIWRLDLIPATDTTKIAEHWKLNKFASLGTDGVSSAYNDNDRRFFNQIDVVRTRRPGTNTNVDALLVGSGNIANPKGATVYGENKFFVIYDENTQPTSATLTTLTVETNLFNASAKDGYGEYLESDVEAGITGDIKGWYWDLDINEKVVSAATTIEGAAYFTTIIAGPDDVGCQAPEDLPTSRIYGLNMHTAKPAYAILNNGAFDHYDRYTTISSGLAFQQIDPFVATDGNVSIILPGDKDAVRTGTAGDERKLKGAGAYWRTEKP